MAGRMRSPAAYRDRALAPDASADELRELARCPYPFVWQALAERSDVTPDVLALIVHRSDSAWNDNALLARIAASPRADRQVLLAVLDRILRLLANGQRPYAAGLALVGRVELTDEEASQLLAASGGSRRFRAGVRMRLMARTAGR
ncbi:hypothetical protein [Myceligenerans pegani]|uniref:Uncharacterized protein n=1 Tax=Myceligenerans pegani TaxID=2776917 RepID=A0ABR9N498_9MICO|nr:hypothetical protein [Myceligenerans sp. TRM 65318]MBE1878489.1 hypothetical protein [Myceligenerans sp. TRM 65318]MBE3020760.1 hypothetical protein [Myceligenerans sp. TRM 65318]